MRSINDIPTTLTLTERIAEYRDLGVPNWQIAKRMGMTETALARALLREQEKTQ